MTMHEMESTMAEPSGDERSASTAGRRPIRDEFDALADPHRREILRMLHDGDRSVSELAARLPISRPAVSRHLRLLAEAGLVAESHSGTRHIFRLRPEGARAVQDYLERVWGATGSQPAGEALAADPAEPGT
jgi:DNA-binding transcriptional ArsR family regulator